MNLIRTLVAGVALLFIACSPATDDAAQPASLSAFKQAPDDLLANEVMAVAYSGFREGQHPDRGEGAANPSEAEILEDLQILVSHDFKLIRLYDTDDNSVATLEIFRQHDLPINVSSGNAYEPPSDATADFHDYALEWDEKVLRWYVDGVIYAMQNAWSSTSAPFPAPFRTSTCSSMSLWAETGRARRT